MDPGAEAGDGEEVPPTVPEESRVEELFAEVEQRGGLAWGQRGIFPLLVVSDLVVSEVAKNGGK